VPIALAGLFAFLLAPLADRAERLRVARGLSAVLCVTLGSLVVAGILWVTAAEAMDFAERLPSYRRNVETKLETVRGSALVSLFDVDRVFESTPSEEAAATDPKDAVLVRPLPPRPTALETVASFGRPLLAPLGALAIVVVLTVFLLAYRADVRDLLIRLMSRENIGLTTQAFDEASRRVGRYLAAALLVNTIYGSTIAAGLFWIGIPNAVLWGVLAGLLRFVPYFGAWIGGALPFAVAFAAFDGWGPALGVAALVLCADLAIGNALEPVVYGKRTGLSPLAVVVAILFWTWLWGFAGLLLAVPLTLCLAVAGRYVPGLEFLDVLLRDRPALGPADRAYQRLVALDAEGVRRVAEETLRAASPGETAVEEAEDEVLFAALRRAEVDRLRGALDDDRLRCVCDGVVEAAEGVEDLAARATPSAPAPAAADAEPVLCLPAGDATDRAACEVVARRLGARGRRAEVGAPGTLSGEAAERVARERPALVLVSAVPPFASTRVRYLVKRIRSRAPDAAVLAAVWDPAADRARLEAAFLDAGADRSAFSLRDAMRAVDDLLAERAGGAVGSRARRVVS
jgi:predicted PurR-regulated permease PerM